MKTQNDDFSKAVLTRVIQLALLALFAVPGLSAAQVAPAAPKPADQKTPAQKTTSSAEEAAEEEGEGDVKDLVCPSNYFEIGALNVPSGSPKFGEYNGMAKSGVYGIGNFNVQGGNGHCQRGGALRWQITGKDLATTARSIGGTVGEQGKWTVGLDFDQLRHYTTTSYQTPYQGSLGGNTFLLPPSFGVINATAAVPPNNQIPLTAAQLASFRSINVYNQRKNATFNFGYNFNTEWSFKFDYKHLDMSGGKLISAPTEMTSLAGFNYGSERAEMLMNPTKSTTDNFTASINWVGNKAYASAEYYGSLYHDDYRGMSWSNPYVLGGTATAPDPAAGTLPAGGAFPVNTMSTPPSNQLHQINLSGGYFFSPKTKLTGGLSFGVNTQNASFDGTYTPGSVPGLAAPSLSGRVLTKHADAKLTHQFTPALNLNVGFKYNERDNNTPVNTYQFVDIINEPLSVTTAPMSNKREQVDAVLTYRIDKRQRLDFGYSYDHIDRWCRSALANNAQGNLTGSATAGYYTTASCAQVPKSTDNSLNLGYKLALFDRVSLNAGYTHSDRDATVNSSFYNPMQINAQGFENYGWLAWFQGSRREDLLKAGVTWQMTEKFNVGLNGRYAKDDYYDTTLGVQKGNSGSFNLEADYVANENISFGAYLSWQRRARDLLTSSAHNAMTPATTLWGNTLTDRDTSIGLYGKQKMKGGRLQFTEDISYGEGRTNYYTTLVQNIASATGNSGAPPDITSRLLQLRLIGSYAFSKASRLTFGYMYQRLRSNDYYYNGYQLGYAGNDAGRSSVMPSNQVSPNYSVNVVYLIYRYTFQ